MVFPFIKYNFTKRELYWTQQLQSSWLHIWRLALVSDGKRQMIAICLAPIWVAIPAFAWARGRWWQTANIVLPYCNGPKGYLNHVVIGSSCCCNSPGDAGNTPDARPMPPCHFYNNGRTNLKFRLHPLHANRPPSIWRIYPRASVTQVADVRAPGLKIRLLECAWGANIIT